MQFSKKWLNAFVDKDLNEIKLREILTQGGLEVEEIEDLSLISDLVVVGEIVDIQKHPNADRLNICQVNVGQKDNLQIVCGAPNARVGIKVPCAKVGAKLDKFEIKNLKYIGNLKFSQTEKEEDQISIKQKKFFRSKNIWCASSTHNSEEILIGTAHKKLKKNSAQKRQSLYLAKLLRAIDLTDAQQFVDQLKFESQTEIKKFHKVEDWRDKLLADISNLTDFVNLSPGIDIQKLRKLILNTQREVKKGIKIARSQL